MKNLQTLFKTTLFVLLIFLIPKSSFSQNDCSDYQARITLFETLVNKTIERTAWSPYKTDLGDPKNNYRTLAEPLRSEFSAADTDQKLARVLLKLSNLRHDTHLSLGKSEVHTNFSYDDSELETTIRFGPDFVESDHSYYVMDLAVSGAPSRVCIGDKLIKVNDVPIDEYQNRLLPFIRYSTVNNMRWKLAPKLSIKNELYDQDLLYLDDNKVIYTLENSNGIPYDVELEYTNDEIYGYREQNDDFIWEKAMYPTFYGFKKELVGHNYDLYVYKTSPKVLLLNWKGFHSKKKNGVVVLTVEQDIQNLMNYVVQEGYLDNDLILYAPFSGGGHDSPYLLQRLTDKPFKTTFGNVRMSNIIPDFLSKTGMNSTARNWIVDAYNNGEDYASNQPFKFLYFNEVGSDGVMDPHPIHFTGNKVAVFSSLGGSNLDQFNAMVNDNNKIPIYNTGITTIGYPTGGFSNTWEYEEDIRCPYNGGEYLVHYMWNIGQTIRPNGTGFNNGEILEGNPAYPDELIHLTRVNCLTYFDDLIDRAWNILEEKRSNSGCSTGILVSDKTNRFLRPNGDALKTSNTPNLWDFEHIGGTSNSVLVRDASNNKKIAYHSQSLILEDHPDPADEIWEMQSTGNFYKFYNRSENKYWDADGSSNNYRVDVSSEGSEEDQKWKLDCREIPRTVTIKNERYNRYLKNDNSNNVVTSSDATNWQLEFIGISSDGNNVVFIRDQKSKRYLDGDSSADTSSNNGGDEKQWEMIPLGNDTYYLRNCEDDRQYLDAEGSGHDYNVDVDDHLGNGATEHEERKWQFIPAN